MRPARLCGVVPVDKPGRRVRSPGRGLRGCRRGLCGPGAPGCRGWVGCAYVPKVQVRVWAMWGCFRWSVNAYLPEVEHGRGAGVNGQSVRSARLGWGSWRDVVGEAPARDPWGGRMARGWEGTHIYHRPVLDYGQCQVLCLVRLRIFTRGGGSARGAGLRSWAGRRGRRQRCKCWSQGFLLRKS